MTRPRIYLDYAAATPVRGEVLEAMAPYWRDHFGNPSAITEPGVTAAAAITSARADIAQILSVRPDELIFTSSGTESANLAVFGIMEAQPEPGHLITSAIEHHAVLEPARALAALGHDLTIVPVQPNGIVSLGDIIKVIRPETRLISLMLANNEIGTIQPVAEFARALKKINRDRKSHHLPPIFLHSDACQATSYLDLSLSSLWVDALTINAAKIGGPKGVGLLYLKRGTPSKPQIVGGGQEAGRRSGTENVPGIVGLATAFKQAASQRTKEAARLKKLRDRFLKLVAKQLPDVSLIGDPAHRLPNHLSLAIPGVEAEMLVLYLDEDGLAIGAGAACSSQTLEPSHVLRAIGLSEQAALSVVRITLGYQTTAQEIDMAANRFIQRVTWLSKKQGQ